MQGLRQQIQPVSPDATAELAMDDLGIDLGDLDALSGDAPEDDVTRLMPADEATRSMPAGEGDMDFDLSADDTDLAVPVGRHRGGELGAAIDHPCGPRTNREAVRFRRVGDCGQPP